VLLIEYAKIFNYQKIMLDTAIKPKNEEKGRTYTFSLFIYLKLHSKFKVDLAYT